MLESLHKLQPRHWQWKRGSAHAADTDLGFGLVAQEVEAAGLGDLLVSESSVDGTKAVSYERLTAVLLSALQAESGRAARAEARIGAQDERLRGVEAELATARVESAALSRRLAALERAIGA